MSQENKTLKQRLSLIETENSNAIAEERKIQLNALDTELTMIKLHRIKREIRKNYGIN